MFRLLFLLLVVSASLRVSAQLHDPAGYERVLLPLLFESPQHGAFGSVWISEFVGRSEATAPVRVFTSECAFTCECVVITCPGPQLLSPGYPFTAYPPGYQSNPGALLYVGRSADGPIPMQLRVRDRSRSHRSVGTEIPVVRETEAFRSTIYLLNIPIRSDFRHHLRIYGIGKSSATYDVQVRIYVGHGPTPVVELPLRLTPEIGLEKDEFPSEPAYGEVPNVLSLIPSTSEETMRIEVVPESAELFWAFVSVTNNDSQEVTLVTPQQ